MDTTKKTTPKITDFETFHLSPFTVEIGSRLIAPKVDHKVVEDKESGKMYGMYELPKGATVLHDSAKYTKLFKETSLILSSLTEPATKMFYYICEHLKVGSDEICIFKDDYLAFYSYKAANKFAYYRAIEGLLKSCIIARKAGSTTCFFINPNILFNGDRTKLSNIVIRPSDNGTIRTSR